MGLGLTFSVVVLAGIILFLFVGGSTQKVPNQVELIGSGHSVRFSQSAITIHDADGACPSNSNRGFLFFLNETGTTQSVIGIDPNQSDGGITGLPRNESGQERVTSPEHMTLGCDQVPAQGWSSP